MVLPGQNGAGEFIQIEVEAPQPVPVLLQIVHIKQDGPAKHPIVKHGAGIVGDHQVGSNVEIIDLLHTGDIQHKAGIGGEVKGGGHQIVRPKENDVVFPQLLTQLVKIHRRAVGVALAGNVLIVPEGGSVENGSLSVRDPQLAPQGRPLLLGGVYQPVISGIAHL